MASFRIEVKRTAVKEIAALQKADCQHVVGRMQALANEPRPAGCEKLTGDDKYRGRQGDCRILHEIDDESRAVTIVKVGNRREVYR